MVSDDNVIPIGKAHQPAFKVTGAPALKCTHGSYNVDVKRRVVTCSRCSCELDPFAVVLKIGERWKRIDENIRRCQADRDEAQERLDELRKQEANAKARLRRLEAKLARGGQ